MDWAEIRRTADEIDAGDWYNVNPPTHEWSSALREAADEIDKLRQMVPGNWETTYSSVLCHLDDERKMADDLADVLARMLVENTELVRLDAHQVMTRYREARA